MATARTTQTHEKRVQKIAAEAAEKIAASSPLEEEVTVFVEESPPGESPRTQLGRSTPVEDETGVAMLSALAQGQHVMADSINRWVAMVTAPFGAPVDATDAFGGLLDPRRLTEESFRVAEAVIASQKEFALKVVDAFTSAKAA